MADYVWLGFTDEASEGNYVWVNGDPITYTNWNSGEPNNSNNQEHFARLLKHNGKWTDRDEWFTAEIVLEIPCTTTEPTPGEVGLRVEQISGLPSGSEFPVGELSLIHI